MKITVNNKIYQVNCIKEEEQKIAELAKKVNQKIISLKKNINLDNENLLLLLCLMNEGELENLEVEKEKTYNNIAQNLEHANELVLAINSRIDNS